MHHSTVTTTPALALAHPDSAVPFGGVSTRLDLEGLTVDVDVIDDHLEVTAGIPGRTTVGLALTRSEACRLAVALLEAGAPLDGGQR